MARPLRFLLLAVVVTAVLVGGGLALAGGNAGGNAGGKDDGGAPPKPAATPTQFHTTPLSELDGSTVTVRRAAFCDRIDPRQVTAALGGPATAHRSWNDGDRTVLSPGVKDVAHEFGCEYTGAAGVVVRAWVFAPPVGAARARQLAQEKAGAGCVSVPGSFGSPGSAASCHTAANRSARFQGLFGDAWLSCELDVPAGSPVSDAQLSDRAGRWCVGVAESAG